jgi:hypothetical protein
MSFDVLRMLPVLLITACVGGCSGGGSQPDSGRGDATLNARLDVSAVDDTGDGPPGDRAVDALRADRRIPPPPDAAAGDASRDAPPDAPRDAPPDAPRDTLPDATPDMSVADAPAPDAASDLMRTEAGVVLAPPVSKPWVVRGKDNSYLDPFDAVTDEGGNTYLAGSRGKYDAFVAKLGRTGRFLWKKSAYSTGSYPEAEGRSVAVDYAGDVYLNGWFTSALTAGSIKLTTSTSSYSSSLFVAKLDGKTGAFIWANKIGEESTHRFSGASSIIAVDSSKRIYAAGTFGRYYLFGSTLLSSQGPYDVFVARLEKDGKLAWVTSAGGQGKDRPTDIAVDSAGNSYVTGELDYKRAPSKNMITFGTTNLSVTGDQDIFIAKLNTSGRFLWARVAGGGSWGPNTSNAMALDSAGNSYIIGNFVSPAVFGNTTLTSKAGGRGYITKLSSAGAFLWTRQFRAAPKGISLDHSNNIYISGYFQSFGKFGSISFTGIGTWSTNSGLFVSRLNPKLQFDLAFQGGGNQYYNRNYAWKIGLDRSGSAYLVGFAETCIGHKIPYYSRYYTWKFDLHSPGFVDRWVSVAPGTFKMGSPATELCRRTDEIQHAVTLSHKLEVMIAEVSRWRFYEQMGYQPSTFAACSPTLPIESVSWYEAAAYCNTLSGSRGLKACYKCVGKGPAVACNEAAAYRGAKIYACPGYRLPTEAEWEYLYRAGGTSALYNGGIKYCAALDPNASTIAWYRSTSPKIPQPVATKFGNRWRLYDMAGNVAEWVNDRYQANLGSAAVTDPWGSATSPYRGIRGGEL